MKNKYVYIGLAVLLFGGGVWWSNSLEEKQLKQEESNVDVSEIISRNGVHWHPKLEIYVNDEQQPIPVNIGIGPQYAGVPTYDAGMRMTAMHTHETDGTIHLEFPKLVTTEDIKLRSFFTIWGKNFMEFGSSVTMTVNGVENTELENYQMRDDDVIILKYQI